MSSDPLAAFGRRLDPTKALDYSDLKREPGSPHRWHPDTMTSGAYFSMPAYLIRRHTYESIRNIDWCVDCDTIRCRAAGWWHGGKWRTKEPHCTRGKLAPAVIDALAQVATQEQKALSRNAPEACFLDGAKRRVEWLARHRLVARANRDYCPCLIGTKRQICTECRGPYSSNYCWVERRHGCGWDHNARLTDHCRTWTRDGVRTIFTTEPYYDLTAEDLKILNEWGARHLVAVFSHGKDASFHYPGRTTLIAIMPLHAADEYTRLETSALRVA